MPITHLMVQDLRLDDGNVVAPGANERLILTNECTPLSLLTRQIRRHSHEENGRHCAVISIPVLSLMGHGVRVLHDDAGRDRALQIGEDYIHSGNALEFGRSIRGVVSEKVRVLGCNAAATEDGRLMCRRLAIGTGVNVYAAAAIQDFTTFEGSMVGSSTPTRSWINFGAWEGEVYLFDPSGGHRLAWRGPDPVSRPSGGGGGATAAGACTGPRFTPSDWRVTTAY